MAALPVAVHTSQLVMVPVYVQGEQGGGAGGLLPSTVTHGTGGGQ
jgi:hypothetical protein